MGGTLRADFIAVDSSQAQVIVRRCAAYAGARRAGLPRTDQACVACETLWAVWLDTLLPDSCVEVQYPRRQGMGDPYCQFLIRVSCPDDGVPLAN